MTDNRSRIIERISRAIGSRYAGEDVESAFRALCDTQSDKPAQPELSDAEIKSTFTREAQRNGATVNQLQNLQQVPEWLVEQARHSGNTPTVSLSPWVVQANQDWGSLTMSNHTPEPANSWGVVRAHAAIAETGTVVFLSDECPSNLLFLVERLIVLIDKQDILRYQEDVWSKILTGRQLPRTVNLVTGPSRTADIEQQIQIGAHGPRQTDYLILDFLDHNEWRP